MGLLRRHHQRRGGGIGGPVVPEASPAARMRCRAREPGSIPTGGAVASGIGHTCLIDIFRVRVPAFAGHFRHCEEPKATKQSRPLSGLWIAHMGIMYVNAVRFSFFRWRSEVEPVLNDLVCLPDQTHIRSSREATAPGFRLRRAGSRGRDHSSLRPLKPSNPSVRPPGSAGLIRSRQIGEVVGNLSDEFSAVSVRRRS